MVDDSPPPNSTDILIASPEVREARDAVLSAGTELTAFPSRTDPSFDDAAYRAKLQVVGDLTARYAEISAAAAANAAAAAVVTPPPHAAAVFRSHCDTEVLLRLRSSPKPMSSREGLLMRMLSRLSVLVQAEDPEQLLKPHRVSVLQARVNLLALRPQGSYQWKPSYFNL